MTTTPSKSVFPSQPKLETAHTPTPWRVFTTTDGRKLVGIGSQEGEGILDCGFGVWAWDDAEGIANANLVVEAVNSHASLKARIQALEEALRFYANPYRYDGPNMPPLPDDPFQPEHLVYRMDVTRDFGSVARAALQPKDSAK